MKKIYADKLKWQFNERENVYIGIHSDLISEELGVYHARISPGEELKKHLHKRPNDGKEIFFFHKGGHFLIELENRQEEINSKVPVYIIFANLEVHGVKNLGKEPLEFQAIYCPDFQPGEVFYP